MITTKKLEHLTSNTGHSVLKNIVTNEVTVNKIKAFMKKEKFGFGTQDKKMLDAFVFTDNEITHTKTGFITLSIGKFKVPVFEICKNGILITANYILPVGFTDGAELTEEKAIVRKNPEYPCLLTNIISIPDDVDMMMIIADYEFCIASYILGSFELTGINIKEKLSFLGKDRVKLTIEALYSRCDLILVPNKDLESWLMVDGEVNSEIQKQFDKNQEEIGKKLGQFNCIGLHRKKANEFLMSNNDVMSVWSLTSNGRSYELIFTAQFKQIGTHIDFYSIKLDKRMYAHAVNLNGYSDDTTFLEIADAVAIFFGAFVGYYALNPFIIYEDLRTHGNGSNGDVMTRRKREENVIPLTINHHKHKIRNGVNVMDTETGRIYPSIAETARQLDYIYGTLWLWLKDNIIPPLKRIEKLH